MSSVFERFCHNDVEKSCVPFFNCTPCHLTLADPSCNWIQYVDPANLHSNETLELIPAISWKTEAEMKKCTDLRSECQEEFEECLAPFQDCISKCALNLSEETLDKYSTYEGIK